VTSGLSLEMNNSFEASVQTDKLDYHPGDTLVITGSGGSPQKRLICILQKLPLFVQMDFIYLVIAN
jgi:hypothetical protein